ncbi:ParA family protein [Apilactobacillus micheneri]|uniref:ParA family protein n=1 Tax=Apilactobacillus micheneri TaxID=1899430 RepID=UPI00112633A7|nr:AAA family ATPase [Apilactobacillus micheneri]TPR47015.1 ParA family protein [Apilactobacillus micheneri]
MTQKILFGNFKGGVGKTTNSVMTAYELANRGYKTLVCDLDPQANSTQLLRRTYALQNGIDLPVRDTMMEAIRKGDLRPQVKKIMDNLYLIPSFKDFENYPDFLELEYMPTEENYKEKRMAHFSKLLKEVGPTDTDDGKNKFDYIIFDVPPSLSIFTSSALYDTDYVVVVFQTQQRSLDGAVSFFEYLQTTYDNYQSLDFDVAGVLPVLMKNNVKIDSQMMRDCVRIFGEDSVFKNYIPYRVRLQTYDRQGIQEKGKTEVWDAHDNKVHKLYNNLVDEIMERIQKEDD